MSAVRGAVWLVSRFRLSDCCAAHTCRVFLSHPARHGGGHQAPAPLWRSPTHRHPVPAQGCLARLGVSCRTTLPGVVFLHRALSYPIQSVRGRGLWTGGPGVWRSGEFEFRCIADPGSTRFGKRGQPRRRVRSIRRRARKRGTRARQGRLCSQRRVLVGQELGVLHHLQHALHRLAPFAEALAQLLPLGRPKAAVARASGRPASVKGRSTHTRRLPPR